MNLDPIIPRLREQAFYAGQIYRLESVEAMAATIHPVSSALERMAKAVGSDHITTALGDLFGFAGVSSLHEHQEKCLTRLLRGQDAVLAASPGLGRGVVVCFSALYRALHQRQTVLILAANNQDLNKRIAFLRRIIRDMGVDYACTAGGLNDSPGESPAFPDILVTTPVRLIRLLEGGLITPFSRDFLRALSLLIIENTHQYHGSYGQAVANLIRCMQIERHAWRDDEWQVLAIGTGYRNLVDIASRLTGKALNADTLISTTQAGQTSKQLVFWNPPLIRNEGGDKYIRKDYVDDVRSLILFLARQGLSSEAEAPTRFVVLVDRSISMAGKPWNELCGTLSDDLPRLVGANDTICLRAFDAELGQPIISGKRSDIETDGNFKELLEKGLKKEDPERRPSGTEIGTSLLDTLDLDSTGLISGDRLALFLYSDGEDNVPPDLAHKIIRRIHDLTSKKISVNLIYIPMGTEPGASVKSLILSCGGRLIPYNDETKNYGILLSDLWKVTTVDERPVFVLAYDDSLTPSDIQRADLADTRRPIIFRNRMAFPQLDNSQDQATDPALSKAKYIVVVGWDASPALMRHTLQHLGNQDAVLFLVGTPKAGTQALLRQWPGLNRIEDVLSLGADTPEMLQGMARSFFRMRRLGKYEVKKLFATRTYTSEDLNTATDSLAQVHDLPSSILDTLTVARKPIPVRDLTIRGHMGFMDRLEPFRMLLPGGDLVVNGSRRGIHWESGQGFVISDHADRSSYAFAHAQGAWSILVNEDGDAEAHLFGYNLSRRVIQVALEMDRVDRYPGARYDEAPHSVDRKHSARFTTNAIVMELQHRSPDKDKAVLAGTENLIINYLAPLIRADPRSLCALADIERGSIAIFQIADGSTDLPNLLSGSNYALLSAALRTGFLALMDCPCCHYSSIGEKDSVDADRGCPWCLQAPTKLAGLGPELLNKKALLEFLGKADIVSGYPVLKRLTHKYKVLDDNERLTGDVEGGSICRRTLSVLDAKLGIRLPDKDQASVAFASESEIPPNSGSQGWYNTEGNKIRIKPAHEFQVLDVLAHEYGHNWQYKEPLPPESPAFLGVSYNRENVEDPTNLPFLSLLFVEGSAVWIETHAMDFFAYRAQLNKRGVGAEEPGCHEYWQGLRVMKYIEEKYGMKAVFDFLRTGDVSGATGQKIPTLEHLYEYSGLKGYLINEGRDAANANLVPLFGRIDLAQPENLIRVSAWLKLRGQGHAPDSISPRGKNSKGKPESDKEYLARLDALFVTEDLQLHTLLTIPQFRDNGADTILAEEGLGEYIQHEHAWNISLFLACHLASSAAKHTSALLKPLLAWIKDQLEQFIKKSA